MASAKATVDHDEVRAWVEARGGHPAHVKRVGTGADPGILRIDYPGFSGQGTLERISWNEFFEAFDADNLAFLYQDESDSRFSKLVDRRTVDVSAKKSGAKRAGARPRSIVERITSAVTGGRKSRSSSKKRSSAKKASSSKKRGRSGKASSSKSPAKRKTSGRSRRR